CRLPSAPFLLEPGVEVCNSGRFYALLREALTYRDPWTRRRAVHELACLKRAIEEPGWAAPAPGAAGEHGPEDHPPARAGRPGGQREGLARAPQRVALYVRVSSEEQLEGSSLDAQRRAARALCAVRGWQIVAKYAEEGRSARYEDLSRPQPVP